MKPSLLAVIELMPAGRAGVAKQAWITPAIIPQHLKPNRSYYLQLIPITVARGQQVHLPSACQ